MTFGLENTHELSEVHNHDANLSRALLQTPINEGHFVSQVPGWETCLRRWAAPVTIVALSLTSIAIGATCWMPQEKFFVGCSAVFIPVGFVLPVVLVLISIYLSRPTSRQKQAQDFYSNALLEDFIAAEDQSPLYVIRNKENAHNRGVVVLLSGVGGIAGDWASVEAKCVKRGFCVVTVQLPGSGKLNAVKFSFKRAARIVSHMLDREFLHAIQFSNVESLGHRQERRFSSAARASNNLGGQNSSTTQLLTTGLLERISPWTREGVEAEEHTEQGSNATVLSSGLQLPKVVLVGYGLCARVVCHLCSNRRLGASIVHGVVVGGSRIGILPSPLSFWSKLKLSSFQLPWVADISRRFEYHRFIKLEELRGQESPLETPDRTVQFTPMQYNPVARYDWSSEADSHFTEHFATVQGFQGFVSLISADSKALLEASKLWGSWAMEAKGHKISTVERMECKAYPYRSSVPRMEIPDQIIEQIVMQLS